MKVPAAALAALLLVAICSPAEAHVGDSGVAASVQKPDVPMACCFSYLYHCIPHSFIASTYKTSSKCPQPGVIFVTRNGRKICTDPQEPWVQEQLKCFQMLKY